MHQQTKEDETAVTNDFAAGSVRRHVISMAIPLTLAQLVQVLYNVVDRIYLGHLPGENGMALTGIGLIFPITVLIAAFTQLFGNGGAPLSSIARGEGDLDRASKIQSVAMTSLCISSVLIMVFCYLFKKPILYAFGASDRTYVYANQYLEIYLIGTVFSMVGTGMNAFINAQGFARVGMCTTVIGAVLNLILDPVFIFLLGFGIRGAAIATVISQAVSCLWVVGFLMSDKAIMRIDFRKLSLDLKILRRSMALGMTGFIMQATNAACQIVCNKVLSIYGGDLYLGVMTVLNSVREIFSLPVNGITSGAQPVLGYNYGAKLYGRVKQGIQFMTLVGVIYTLAAWGVVFMIPEALMRLFTNDATLISMGVPALHIYFFGYVFMALQFSGQSTHVALGRAKASIFFSIFRKIVLVVPLTILLPMMGLGVNGVFWAEPISNVIGGVACFTTMMLTVWKDLTRLQKEQERITDG